MLCECEWKNIFYLPSESSCPWNVTDGLQKFLECEAIVRLQEEPSLAEDNTGCRSKHKVLEPTGREVMMFILEVL